MGELAHLPIIHPHMRPVVDSFAPPIREGVSRLLLETPMDPSENIGDYLFRVLNETPRTNSSKPYNKSGKVEFRSHRVRQPDNTYRGIISVIRYKQEENTLGYVVFGTLPTGRDCIIIKDNDILPFPGVPQSDYETIVTLDKQSPWKDATEVVDISCMLGDIDLFPRGGGIPLTDSQASYTKVA